MIMENYYVLCREKMSIMYHRRNFPPMSAESSTSTIGRVHLHLWILKHKFISNYTSWNIYRPKIWWFTCFPMHQFIGNSIVPFFCFNINDQIGWDWFLAIRIFGVWKATWMVLMVELKAKEETDQLPYEEIHVADDSHIAHIYKCTCVRMINILGL